MKKSLKSGLDFLLFSNLFIAICAVAQGLLTFKLIGSKPVYIVLGVLFFSTVCIYNFSILLIKPINADNSPFRRIRWIFSHYRLMITFSLVSALSIIPLFFLLSIPSKILLIFLGLFSFSYGLPLFSIKGEKFGLRNLPGLKLFLIAFVWAVSCVLLPVLEAESLHYADLSMRDTILLVAKRFLFVAAITIPFDIRDLFQDNKAALKTIPVIMGEKKAYLFCQVLLIFYLILLFLFRNNGVDLTFWALALTVVFTGWLIFRARMEKNEYYYFLYLDGTLLLQYLLLLICESTFPLIK